MSERIERLQDREAIRRCVMQYSFLNDTGQVGRIAEELFALDAVLCFGPLILQGRAEIAQFFDGARQGLAASSHAVTNLAVSIDGERARGRCYVTS